MTKFVIAATAALLAVSAFPAEAQYFPLGAVLNGIGNAANPPPPETRPVQGQGRPAAAPPQKRGRVTHIIPPQSNKPMGHYPRETSGPSEDND